MTERPNDAPGDDLEQTTADETAAPPPDDATPAELAEEAPDLTDADLAAATEEAHLDVEEGEAEGESLSEEDAAEAAADEAAV